MPSLTAKSNPVLVDLGQKSQSTEITYEKEPTDEIWWRLNSSKWIQQPHPSATTPEQLQELARKGQFTSTQLHPGDIYGVRIFPIGQDPNTPGGEFRPEAAIDVFSLLKKPVNANLLSDLNESIGGTYYWIHVTTKVPTFMQLTISRRPPSVNADGMATYDPSNEIVGSAPILTGPPVLTKSAELEVKGLAPGNPFVATVRASDNKGNWQFRSWTVGPRTDVFREFTTLRRKTKVHIAELIVGNDGDPGSSGEADFDFDVMEGPNLGPTAGWSTVASFHYANNNIEDGKPYTLQNFDKELGPESVSADNRFVSVNIRGKEYDGWFEPDETASSGFIGSPLQMPNGKGVETVSDREYYIYTKPEYISGDFNFSVRIVYSVEYVP